MDTFMDKLAQKLTAQEMIKANTAADAEEMKKLKNQVKEYRDILEQVQKLAEDGAAKLEKATVDGSEINRLVETAITKISQMQLDTQEIEEVSDDLAELSENLDKLIKNIHTKLDGMNENAGHLELALGTKLDSANENIHKECVKVYRNVQAVVVEENAKQSESVAAAVNGLKGKLSAVLGVSIVALIAAAGSVVFQLLVYLKVI